MLLSGLTTLGKTVVIIVAATFIAWALITAIFIPKRREVFPRRLDAFILVSDTQRTVVIWARNRSAETRMNASRRRGRPRAASG